MKAHIGCDAQRQALLTLTPETDEERAALSKLATLTGRTCIINHRGFNYMDPNVSFLIQTMPSGD